MRHPTPRSYLLLGLALSALAALSAQSADKKAPTFTAEQVLFYEKQVLPILKENCYKCHASSSKKIRGEFLLDSRAALLKGGELGPAIDLGKPTDSALVKSLHFTEDPKMPPAGKLPAAKIDILTRWVAMGAPYSTGNEVIVKTPERHKMEITDKDRDWWAYRPIRRPDLPKVKDTSWVRNPLDTFILAKLEEKGMKPGDPADRVALARRVTYDLTGLPPTPEQIDAFVADTRPDAYERLVDALLASPAYGEKWGRHWLDLVRFAETNGYERDGTKPYAWRFRDYVVRSFNADKPYDRFVREQLAGDEMPGDDPDSVIATGYYRLGVWDDEPADRKQARADEIDDWVATTGQVFLGMTLNCARCHDHKKDPIPQTDYYRLVAFFQDVREYNNDNNPRHASNLTDISAATHRKTYEAEMLRRGIRRDELTATMLKVEEEAIKMMPAEEQRAAEGPDRPQVLRRLKGYLSVEKMKAYRDLERQRTTLDKLPAPSQTLALSVANCLTRPPVTNLMLRGSPHALGARVEPGFPVVLNYPEPKIPEPAKKARSSGRRSVLADWMGRKDNPMTPRVLANRLWQFHFGRGIVGSSNDFGKLGELPTHPELLDWLAAELTDGDWQLKRLHRLLLLSSTYRLSSRAVPENMARDPANNLWWRVPMRRLTAEEVRDSILTATGQLSRTMTGPGVYPTIPKAVFAGQSVPGSGWGKSSPEEQARRSIYVHVKRSLLVPILQNHDAADTDTTCAVRYTTTVPTQALAMFNGEFTHEQARVFAARLMGESPNDLASQVRRAIRLTTGRAPGKDEVRRDVAYIAETKAESKLDDKTALALYCLLALNANEFMYLD